MTSKTQGIKGFGTMDFSLSASGYVLPYVPPPSPKHFPAPPKISHPTMSPIPDPTSSPSASPFFAYVTGVVYDTNTHAVVSAATVIGYNSQTTLTDASGAFQIYGSIADNFVSVNVEKNGYASTSGVANYNASLSAFFINLYVTQISTVVAFNSAAGVSLSLNNSYGVATQITVPSLVNAANVPLTLQLATIPAYAAPGSLQSSVLGSVSNSSALQSFGMFYINIVDANGGSVDFSGNSIQFSMKLSALNLTNSNGSDPISWYFFNTTSNKWDLKHSVQGVANGARKLDTMDTLNAQAQASGFWNFDRNFRTSCLTGILLAPNGQPCVGGVVNALGVDGIHSIGTADQNGIFCVCNAVTWWSTFYYGNSQSYNYYFQNYPGSCANPYPLNVVTLTVNSASYCPLTNMPVSVPTILRTSKPTITSTSKPSAMPTLSPVGPSSEPTVLPSSNATYFIEPSSEPTYEPKADYTLIPNPVPTSEPTLFPFVDPSSEPTLVPTVDPSSEPTAQPTFNPYYTYVTGVVYDGSSISSPEVIYNATITGYNSSRSFTDSNGTFQALGIISGETISVFVSKSGFADTSAAVQYNSSLLAFYFAVYMTKISAEVPFNPTIGLNVSLNNSYGVATLITIPSLISANNVTLTLQLASIPAYSAPGTLESSVPGSTSNSSALQSFGMFYINIVDPDGGSVDFPGDGVGFSMQMPALNVSNSNGSDPISWYFFNTTSNKWDLKHAMQNVASGARKLNYYDTLNAQAQASGFWNFDRNFRTSCLTGILLAPNGQPCVGGVVNALGVDGIYSIGTADQNGIFCVCNAVTWWSTFYYGNSQSYNYYFQNYPGSCANPYPLNVVTLTVNSASYCPLTNMPTFMPTLLPTSRPTSSSTLKPTKLPTLSPTGPSVASTLVPSNEFNFSPTLCPTSKRTAVPTANPTKSPTAKPSVNSTAYILATIPPTFAASGITTNPTGSTSSSPTVTASSSNPTGTTSFFPTGDQPSSQPSNQPTSEPSF